MNKMLIAIMTLPLFGSVAWAGPDLDAAAGDICECLEEPYKKMRKSMGVISESQGPNPMSANSMIR